MGNRRRLRGGLTLSGLGAGIGCVLFGAFAVNGAPSASTAALLAHVTVYMLFAFALAAPIALLSRGRRTLALMGSVAIGSVIWGQIVEQLDALHWALSAPLPVLFVFVSAMVLAGPVRRAGEGNVRSLVATGAVASVALVLLVLGLRAWGGVTYEHVVHTNRLASVLLHHMALGSPEPVSALLERQLGPARPRVAHNARCQSPVAPVPKSRSVVFVLLDTLRADALERWGGAARIMPNLNRRAQRAVVFSDVRANTGWTRPTVASYFTGLLPEQHGVWGNRSVLPEDVTTLAECARAHGFTTIAVLNNPQVSVASGHTQGFEHIVTVTPEDRVYADAAVVVDEALAALDRHAGTRRPYFLYVHFMDPHEPYYADGGPGRLARAHERSAYERDVGYLDESLDGLLSALEDGSPPDVLIAADHGEAFGERAAFGHRRVLHDVVTRVPVLLLTAEGIAGSAPERLEGRDFFDLVLSRIEDPSLDPIRWARGRERGVRTFSVYGERSRGLRGWLRPQLGVRVQGVEFDDVVTIFDHHAGTTEVYRHTGGRSWLRNRAGDEALEQRAREALVDSLGWWSREVRRSPNDAEIERLRALGYVR